MPPTQAPPRLPPRVLTDLRSGSLSGLAPQATFWKGMELGVRGEPCSQLYIIAVGQVLLSLPDGAGGDTPLYLLGPGEMFGEGSLRPERRWLVNARPVTNVTAHVLPAAHLPRLCQYHPELTSHIIALLSARLDRAHQRVGLIKTHSGRDRLVGLLQVLARDHGVEQEGWVQIPITLTQGELGDMVGLARETVARILAELAQENLVCREGRRSLRVRKTLLTAS